VTVYKMPSDTAKKREAAMRRKLIKRKSIENMFDDEDEDEVESCWEDQEPEIRLADPEISFRTRIVISVLSLPIFLCAGVLAVFCVLSTLLSFLALRQNIFLNRLSVNLFARFGTVFFIALGAFSMLLNPAMGIGILVLLLAAKGDSLEKSMISRFIKQ